MSFGVWEMSFSIWEMSFVIWEMSFAIFWEMSFAQNAQKKPARVNFKLILDFKLFVNDYG